MFDELLRIQLMTIQEEAKKLSELDMYQTMKSLKAIQSNIDICNKLLGEEDNDKSTG